MRTMSLTEEEARRIEVLNRLNVMETSPEADFDAITHLTASIVGVPICLITLLDQHRQWFKSKVGLETEQTPIEWSFCQYTIQQSGIFEIEDASVDPLVQLSPLVTGPPYIRFYAGAPLITSEGVRIGSLCVIDRKPGKLTTQHRLMLETMAGQVVRLLEARRLHQQYADALHRATLASKELDDLNQVKDRLFSVVSHDLRSPLAQLKTFLHLLNQGKLTEGEQKTVLSGVEDHLTHTLTMLDNLLYWSKEQMEGLNPSPINFDLATLLEDVYGVYHCNMVDKKLQFHCEVAQGISVFADQEMTRIVLRNLLSNAIKFTRSGGMIRIQATSGVGSHVHIEVSDTGLGLSKDQIEQIMDHGGYTRPGTEQERGTGLGLSLCKQFIQANGGSLTLTSKPGEGTTAAIVLPLAR